MKWINQVGSDVNLKIKYFTFWTICFKVNYITKREFEELLRKLNKEVNVFGLYKYEWIHQESVLECNHRIYPVFEDGLVLFDGYNYKKDTVSNAIKALLDLRWEKEYFTNNKNYF